MTSEQNEAMHRGLMGIYFDRTNSSYIDGREGKLLYRGFNIHDLAENSTFEEVVYLLLFGNLPTYRDLAQIESDLKSNRVLPTEVLDIIGRAKSSSSMDVLRTAVSLLSSFDPDVGDNSPEATRRKGLRITAQAATIVAVHERLRKGLQIVQPNPKLTHAGNFLYMLFGKIPSEEEAKILDLDFILHAEHGSNASTFAARVVASTRSDLHSALVAAIGALKGPAHGGAAEGVMKMAEEIGTPDKAESYARDRLENRGWVTGFGHRVYKVEDPRARHMKRRAQELGEKKGQPKWFQILTKLQEVMEPYKRRGVHVNIDFFAGSVYHLLGIPSDLFISLFAMGRMPGWTLNVMEQLSNNILIRPLLEYTGPMDLDYIPLDARKENN